MDEVVKNEQLDVIIGSLIDIADGDLSVQIQPSNNNNNLDAVAIGINMMVDNIAESKSKILSLNRELIAAKVKAEESNRLKSAFMATMSHELRTPLNHVIGFSSIISDTTNEEKIKKMANLINESGNNLLSIIEEIFEITLLDQKKIMLKNHTFGMEKLFIKAKVVLIEELRKANKDEIITSKFEIDNSILPLQLKGDMSKVIHVITNLIRNAVKFTKEGEIILSISSQTKDSISISIKDSGIGIPPNRMKYIFEYFRQGDDSNTREHGGIGIGLTVSHKLAELMDGKIEVNSKPNIGSEFIFSFPINLKTKA